MRSSFKYKCVFVFFCFFCVCDFSLQYNTVGVIMVWVSESDTVSVGPAAIYYAHTIFNKSDVMPTRPVTPTRFFISESDLTRQHHYTLFYPPPLFIFVFPSLFSLSVCPTPSHSGVLRTQKLRSSLLKTQNCKRFSL